MDLAYDLLREETKKCAKSAFFSRQTERLFSVSTTLKRKLSMPITCPTLRECTVRLGKDMNWWLVDVNTEVQWDADGLSILDPKQVSHLIEALAPLNEYGLQIDLVNNAFYCFKIEKNLGNGRVFLKRTDVSVLDTDEKLFALPDALDEERGAYADFLDHITRLRVKMLNDLIDFEQSLTMDEIENEIRDRRQLDYTEGRALHAFQEITDILEYIPEGFSLEDENDADNENYDDIPDLDEEETENLDDEGLEWDDDEDEDLDSKKEEDDEFGENEDFGEEEIVMTKKKTAAKTAKPKAKAAKKAKK